MSFTSTLIQKFTTIFNFVFKFFGENQVNQKRSLKFVFHLNSREFIDRKKLFGIKIMLMCPLCNFCHEFIIQ
jgi:hypothetical protein